MGREYCYDPGKLLIILFIYLFIPKLLLYIAVYLLLICYSMFLCDCWRRILWYIKDFLNMQILMCVLVRYLLQCLVYKDFYPTEILRGIYSTSDDKYQNNYLLSLSIYNSIYDELMRLGYSWPKWSLTIYVNMCSENYFLLYILQTTCLDRINTICVVQLHTSDC